jgi:hypothetical protein
MSETDGTRPAGCETRYGRARDVELRSIVGEHFLIVLHAGESKMFSLNGMGLWFWKRLETPASAPELLAAMLSDYEVSEADAAKEIERFLADLSGKRLVERVS